MNGISRAWRRAFLSRRLSIISLRQMLLIRAHILRYLLERPGLPAVLAMLQSLDPSGQLNERVFQVRHAGPRHEGRGCAEGYDCTLDDYGYVVAKALGLVHVVGAEEHAAPLLGEALDGLPRLADGHDIEAVGRLV